MTNEQLVARIQAGEKTADNMLQLWQQMRRFIYTIANKYAGCAEIDDLEQEGYLALYDAVDGFNQDKDIPFVNYAALWIRQRMLRYIQNCSSVVRIPVHECEKLHSYKRMADSFQKNHGRKPSRHEIAQEIHLSYKHVIELEKTARMAQIGSLDRLLSEDGEETVCDMVASAADVEEEVTAAADQELLRELLWPLVDALPGKQGPVLRARFQEDRTLKETGEALGVTTERVRAVQSEGLRGLRRSHNARLLRSFLDGDDGIYSQGITGTGAVRFDSTWTSATERTALRLCERY